MNERHYLIKGTFLLTAAGMLTRTAGFFYKIFLSRVIGAREIGLFQLIMPVFTLCMAVTCGGLQTALSRFTAQYKASKDSESSCRLLYCALLFSAALAMLCCASLIIFAKWISVRYLLEPACEDLLRIIAWSVPFAVIHSCVCGYCIGIKQITLPAFSQLLEQFVRIFTVMFFYWLFQRSDRILDARILALGQIAGELAAALSCMYFLFSSSECSMHKSLSFHACQQSMAELLSVSLPLGLNRIFTCILQSMEASLLPQKIQETGLSSHAALSSYGILTGMALPLVLFPTAITSAAAALLLPMVSEAQTLQHTDQIRSLIRKSLVCTISLGLGFLAVLFFSGDQLGVLLFDSTEAGSYIRLLSFSCPFLYLNTALISVLHGIGKTPQLFAWNLIGFGIRFASVFFLVPTLGIAGYIAGTICSHFFLSCCICFSLRSFLLPAKWQRF